MMAIFGPCSGSHWRGKTFEKKLDSRVSFVRMRGREVSVGHSVVQRHFVCSGLILYSEPRGSTQRPLLCSGPAVLCEQAAGFFRCHLRVESGLRPHSPLTTSNMNWDLVEHRATATWADTTAIVDTLDLRSGLAVDSGAWQGTAIGALPAMQPASSTASVETYVRGTDLVTTHPATKERPTRVQLYWRRWHDLPSQFAAVFELIVSVQTHLLDSDPTIVIESRFPDTILVEIEEDTCKVSLPERQLIIFTHPQDAADIQLIQDKKFSGPCHISHTLFRQRLEKGVILRGRMLFCLSSQKLDLESLDEVQSRFLSAEPILTA